MPFEKDWRSIIMNKLFASQKGQLLDTTWIFLFFRFIIVCIVAIAMVVLVKTYIVTQVQIQQTQAELFMYNMLNEKNGLSYYDNTLQRVYPGVISLSQFQDTPAMEQKLSERMDYGEQSLIAAQLTLFDTKKNVLGTVYYNKEWYQRWIILAKVSWKGRGSTIEYAENKIVLLRYDDGTTEPGILQFSVVMPNS